MGRRASKWRPAAACRAAVLLLPLLPLLLLLPLLPLLLLQLRRRRQRVTMGPKPRRLLLPGRERGRERGRVRRRHRRLLGPCPRRR
jgi:hypothetical protein